MAVGNHGRTAGCPDQQVHPLTLTACVMCVGLLFMGCAGNKTPDSTSNSRREVARAGLGPLPSDRAAAHAWLEANGKRVDGFQRLAVELTPAALPADCTPLAERLNDEIGPIGDYLKQVAASPDPVLAELLTSAAISARTMLVACTAGDTATAKDERSGLANALVLIERREAQLKGRR